MKDNFIMLPTVDYCFKELMKNAKVRKGFVAALLDTAPEKIQRTTLLPTILQGNSPEDKTGILDVRVQMEDQTQLDLEMQVIRFDPWDKRVLFYLGKMYTEQLHKGDNYDKLQKCIHVSILNFIHFPDDEKSYRKIHFYEDPGGKLYTDMLEIQIMELPKLKGEIPNHADVYGWMKFFGGKNREEFEQMAKTNEYMEEAYQQLVTISSDEAKRMEYEAREKELRDRTAIRNTGLREGLQQGFQRGIQQGLQQGLQRGIQQGLQRGVQQGLQQGIQLKLLSLVRNKMNRGCSLAEIASALEEDEEVIRPMMDCIQAHPDWSDEQLLQELSRAQ
jgi:predicted transposase/invertase (TIGR01784 family)